MSEVNNSNGESNKLLTPEQAADVLQVSKRTMYEWLRKGEIPSVKFGDRLVRVRERDVLTPDVRLILEQGLQLAHHPATVERAATFFEKAIRLNPRYNLPYFHLGTMYYEWSHFHKAIEPLKKAIELNPDQPASYLNLAMNYNRAGMYRDAEEILIQALEIVPDHTTAHYELGFALMQQQRSKEAIEHFRSAVKLYPQHAMAYHFLSFSLVIHEHDFAAARELVEELKPLHPQQAEYLEGLISLNEPSGAGR
jgi:excisionase family DNA binding protein